jgi:acetoin utilization deacetylase AcuC-like enzyme
MEKIVLPELFDFGPDLLLISAGFDAHSADPLAMMEMSAGGFAALTALLEDAAGELCGGRLLMTLEGGYDLDALASSLLATLEAMDQPGSGAPKIESTAEPAESVEALERAVAFHRS